MATHHDRPHARDKAPAFIGLVAGGVVIFLILFGVVKWTNTKFEGHETPAAGAARH